MATNLKIDPALVEEALSLSGYRTKREAITEAIQEYIRRKKLRALADLQGTIEFEETYDYKAERRRR